MTKDEMTAPTKFCTSCKYGKPPIDVAGPAFTIENLCCFHPLNNYKTTSYVSGRPLNNWHGSMWCAVERQPLAPCGPEAKRFEQKSPPDKLSPFREDGTSWQR